MPVRFLHWCSTASLLWALLAHSPLAADDRSAEPSLAAPQKVDFARDVQPIFQVRCYACHGPEKQESGLRLDVKVRALAGGDSGAVIIPGDSASSPLFHYVAATDPDTVMPPEGDRLSAEQVALIARWIDQGAAWPDSADDNSQSATSQHWSWQPIARPPVPQVDAAWVRNPIDAFVLDKLREQHVEPSRDADASTLIRRLSLDLLGLPPTVEEADAFAADALPDAYEQLVDRLLDSPHFGERWGRHWLDLARYADSDGYEKDNPRPNAWRWRDWVIDAINRDLPFDQFTIEQLAGDLLPEASEMQRLATAFHRQTLTNTEGGVDQEQFRVEAVFDRVETTATVWLGLTVGCARCHTHKYDPITQREYYRLFAFFNNGDETETDVWTSEAEIARHAAEKAVYDSTLAELQAQLDSAKAQLGPALAAWERQVQAQLEAEAATPPQFHPVEIASVAGNSGLTFESRTDGSIVVSGEAPDTAEYSLTIATGAQPISGFRVEALTDAALPQQGPGRRDNGNFVLTDFRAAIAGETADRVLAWSFARADFSQNEFPAANAIDGDVEKTGWAVGGGVGADHWALFTLAEPVPASAGSAQFKLTLSQKYGGRHTLGRFRITAMTGIAPDPRLSDGVRQALVVHPEQRNAAQRSALLDHYAAIDPSTSAILRQIDELKKNPPKSPNMKVAVIAQRTEKPRTTHILRRGDFLQPAEEVAPGVLDVLHGLEARKSEAPGDRLDLARWLVSAENPLTPRVVVNHVWSRLFGTGLVKTPNDFGVRGELPTHPELLDWLADEFVRLGWSRKALIKLIVMSSTYRQSSAHRPELSELDPRNALLHRQNRFRVEAEVVRDASLHVAGLLSPKIGGPSVFPPLPPDITALSYANNFKWTASVGDDRYRRGMYTFFKRTAPHPNLTAFDCPDANLTCVERQASNTPLQALTTLNNEVFVEASQAMARRVLACPAADDNERLTTAVRLCATHPPGEEQLAQFQLLLAEGRSWYEQHPDEAAQLVAGYAVDGVPPAESAAWTTVCRTLLNLDGFLTRD